jgi:hypothetical protein
MRVGYFAARRLFKGDVPIAPDSEIQLVRAVGSGAPICHTIRLRHHCFASKEALSLFDRGFRVSILGDGIIGSGRRN